MTLEAFTAGVLGAAFLQEHVTARQMVGGAAILAAAAIIARSRGATAEVVPATD